jgi:curved DNA-binding protein
MTARDALEVLGLDSVDDAGRLRSAYLVAVKTAHPDRPGGDAERLRQVIEAYESLRDRRAPEPAPGFSRPAPSRSSPLQPSSRRVEITPMEAVFGGVHSVPMRGEGPVSVRLPPGLRVGDLIGVAGIAMTISIQSDERSSFVGDNLCVRVQVDRAFLSTGGPLEVPTPTGPIRIDVSRQDAARGLVRVDGARLPSQGRHAQSHLFIKLERAVTAADGETRTRAMLRRFTSAWAA